MEVPHISGYTDYRVYLSDVYESRVKASSGKLRPYSYSDFSAAADIKSPNYLKLIIEGKRNLSMDMCKKFARALKLSKQGTKEFELLVSYNQEKDPLLRNGHLKELSEYRARRAVVDGSMTAESYNQVSNWLVWVLYAMVDQEGVRFDPASLRSALRGHVNESQIIDALKNLTDTGRITIDEISKFAMKNKALMSDAEKIPAELVRKIQSELIYLGLEALHRYGPKEREVSGVTLSMTEKEYEALRFDLRKLRKQVQTDIGVNREQSQGERVYQFNVQLFPVTDKVERGKKKSREDLATTM